MPTQTLILHVTPVFDFFASQRKPNTSDEDQYALDLGQKVQITVRVVLIALVAFAYLQLTTALYL
jgi:hypothetical protein